MTRCRIGAAICGSWTWREVTDYIDPDARKWLVGRSQIVTVVTARP